MTTKKVPKRPATSDLGERLRAYFRPEDIEWKPGAYSKDRQKTLAMAYVTNRAIMDRLDEVVGPEGWRNEFRPGPSGGLLCGISIRCPVKASEDLNGGVVYEYEWVTKWDGAENTDIEAIKGGLSSAMKRAAVQWGIGRYLYSLPSVWVPLENGRMTKAPPIPREFLPDDYEGEGVSPAENILQDGDEVKPARAPQTANPPRAGRASGRGNIGGSRGGQETTRGRNQAPPPRPGEVAALLGEMQSLGVNLYGRETWLKERQPQILRHYRVERPDQLNAHQLQRIVGSLNKKTEAALAPPDSQFTTYQAPPWEPDEAPPPDDDPFLPQDPPF